MIHSYCDAAGWFFEHLFLPVFFGAALPALSAPLVGYGVCAWRTLHVHTGWRRRDLLWLPIAVLLLWLGLDLSVLFLRFVDALGQAGWLPVAIGTSTASVIALRTFCDAYLQVMGALARPLSLPGATVPWGLAAYGLLLKAALLAPLLLMVRGLVGQRQDLREPAFRQYLFGEAYQDLQDLTGAALRGLAHYYWRWRCFGVWLSCRQEYVIWLFLVLIVLSWPLLITLGLAALPLSAVAGLLLLPLLYGFHLLLLGLLALGLAAGALLLRLAERGALWLGGGWPRCHHPRCYRPVPRPVHRCPDCGARHHHLHPGRCGVWRRRCRCGRYLPTMHWLGRCRLPTECSHCGQPLWARFGPQLILPIYGSPAAGKTMFKDAALVHLVGGRQPDLAVELLGDGARQAYQTLVRPAFNRGQPPPKTAGLQPIAWVLALRRRAWPGRCGLPVNLHLYDLPGEVTESEARLDQQHYLPHLGGLALLVDPLSLPSLKARYEASGAPVPPDTCTTDPLVLLEMLQRALEHHTGLGATQRFRGRIAVVLTKGDIQLVQHVLGVRLGDGSTRRVRDGCDAGTSAAIRAWLQQHEPAFLQRLTNHFAQVQFFLVSSMGHAATQRRAFAPKRVLEPLLWLLAGHAAVRHPLLVRGIAAGAQLALIGLLVGVLGLGVVAGASGAARLATWMQGAFAASTQCLLAWFHRNPPPATVPQPIPIPQETSPAPPVVPPLPTVPALVFERLVSERCGKDNPAARDSFTVEDAPLIYSVRYTNTPQGAGVLCHWVGKDSVADKPSVIRPGAAECRRQEGLQPGDYEVYVTVGTQKLKSLKFNVAGSPQLPKRPPVSTPDGGEKPIIVKVPRFVLNEPRHQGTLNFTLAKGAEVRVLPPGGWLPSVKKWNHVELLQKTGWVEERYIDLGVAKVEGAGFKSLPVSSEPGMPGGGAFELNNGTRVDLIGDPCDLQGTRWVKFQLREPSGWIQGF